MNHDAMKFFLISILFLACSLSGQTQPPPPMHVTLMFDDGPTTEHLDKFLALFKTEQIHVTFSFIAKHVEAQPQLAKRAVTEGHEVANHSYTHLHPAGQSEATLRHEVVDSFNVLVRELGVAPVLYWPPYVEMTPELEKMVAGTTMKILRPRHLVVSADYMAELSAEEIRKRALEGVDDGSVILFHETRRETLELMPSIIAELRRRGAVFMTASELNRYLESSIPKAGTR